MKDKQDVATGEVVIGGVSATWVVRLDVHGDLIINASGPLHNKHTEDLAWLPAFIADALAKLVHQNTNTHYSTFAATVVEAVCTLASEAYEQKTLGLTYD